MNRGERRAILQRLWSFTSAACSDPVFRRELRYSPLSAFARYGLGWEDDLPTRLPIRHCEICVDFQEAVLFGEDSAFPASSWEWPNCEGKLLLAGAKPMVLEHGPEREMAVLARNLSRQGIIALLSPYEFLPEGDRAKGGYSNLATNQRPAQPGSGAWRSLVGGRESERVQIAWLCLLFGWDEFLGRLLGYPHCCATAFALLWPEARKQQKGEICNVMLRRSSGPWVGRFGWETNVFGRYLGIEAIQHFPCDWNCPSSVRLARRNQGAIATFWPSDAAGFQKLSAPVLYTESSGVFLFPGSRVAGEGSAIHMMFDSNGMLATEPDGEVAGWLRQSGGDVRVQAGQILAGDRSITGWLIDFSGEADGGASAIASSPIVSEKLYEILLPSKP